MKIVELPYIALETRVCHPPYVLLKTEQATQRERWSILGWDPVDFWAPMGQDRPLDTLDQLVMELTAQIDNRRLITDNALPIPTLMGALSYDLGRTIEELPTTAHDPWNGLQAVMYVFRRFIIMDEWEKRGWEVSGCHSGDEFVSLRGEAERRRGNPDCPTVEERTGLPRLAKGSPRNDRQNISPNNTHGSNFTQREYMNAVARIRDMIAAGDCYQVNLSQQCVSATTKSAAEIFRIAIEQNPAPMMGLVDTGDFQIISTSPERLIQRREGRLLSQPIKGTIARGVDADADRHQREALLASAKDRAELAMIIDLVRNDLGRVATTGSVAVVEPYGLQSYTNVHHLVATVEARAKSETTWGAILRALFPGGSVTGCPKVQAMQVIEALEGVRRGFYCGSVGYIGANGNGDFNIAIRTMTKVGEQVIYNLGGGVVFDSEPELEYEETLAKGETMMSILTENR